MIIHEGDIMYTFDERQADELRFIKIEYVHEVLMLERSEQPVQYDKVVFTTSEKAALRLINKWNAQHTAANKIHHKYWMK